MVRKSGFKGMHEDNIALKSVHFEGWTDGLLTTMSMTQHYRNDSGQKLEIIYSFTLARGAELLGMNVSLGGRLLRAVVVDRQDAQERYEETIESGNSPILVEQSMPGVYTANLGNIEPGESVSVELAYAQLPRFGESGFTLRIPCVIAPRFGSPRPGSGLAPHESVAADILAEYPLTLRVVLRGDAAAAAIEHMSHACEIREEIGSKEILLRSGGMLDRDFHMKLSGLHSRSRAMLAKDGDGHMVFASFVPRLPQGEERLRLKVLVDCSSSMAGDSMAQAKRTLFALLDILQHGDYVSVSRFGDSVTHETGGYLPFSLENSERLIDIFQNLQADMGGKRVEEALLALQRDIAPPENDSTSFAVLLITDGALWNQQEVVDAVPTDGGRIFTMGMGSAPGDILLLGLAEKTGGVCELDHSRKSGDGTNSDVLAKLRAPVATPLRVDWGSTPIWQSALPSCIYDGEGVNVFALLPDVPERVPVLNWVMDGREEQLPVQVMQPTENDALVRIGGAKRMAEAATEEEARKLALSYQLTSEHSSLFLVHMRDDEKNDELPVLHQVPQMMTAGHSGFGTTRAEPEDGCHNDLLSRQRRSAAESAQRRQEKIDNIRWIIDYNYDAAPAAPTVPSPYEVLHAFNDAISMDMDGMAAILEIWESIRDTEVGRALEAIGRENCLPIEQICVLLLHWLDDRRLSFSPLSEQAKNVMENMLKPIPDYAFNAAMCSLNEKFYLLGDDFWNYERS